MTASAHGIEVDNALGYAVDAGRLIQAARTVIQQQNADPNSGVTIVIADDDAVRQLNRSFRGSDSVTDVLSFPADSLPAEVAAQIGEAPYLGDLVIAYPYATEQARALGHAPDDSLALLVVHGVLHLLGYDHDSAERRAEMWTAQENALTVLRISPALVPGMEDASHD